VSRDDFFKGLQAKQVLSVHALIVFSFTIFDLFVDQKIEVLACAPKLLNNFEIHLVTRFKDLKAAIFTTENVYRKLPVIL
jgi:hypothetical protein